MKNALIAIDPKTGAVLAYYGGPDAKNYAGKPDYYDYASLGTAPPGSSFKPYTLATALSQTVEHKSQGRPITINSVVRGNYCVTIEATKICNDPSDQQFSSPRITVRNAIKYSLNTTFDLMAQKVGPQNVAATAHSAGIPETINGKPSLTGPDGTTSFGIGIGDYPVHPIDQAAGFATFANAGIANQPFFVEEATDSHGSVVYRHKSETHAALDPRVANDVTLALEPIAGFSGVPLANGRVSAAKTGTEGIQSGPHAGQNSDAWMVGYTPQVSTAVWVGSGNATTPIYSADGGQEYGRDMPGRTWQRFMNIYLRHKPLLPMATKQEVFAGNKAETAGSASFSAPTSAAPATSTSSSAAPTRTSSSPTAPSTTARPSTSSAPPTTVTPSSLPTTTRPPSPTSTTPSPPPTTTTAPPPTSSSAAPSAVPQRRAPSTSPAAAAPTP
jgi:membrane peptidoglycan carboxypeptidase